MDPVSEQQIIIIMSLPVSCDNRSGLVSQEIPECVVET